MIEWVPINDWELKTNEPFLIYAEQQQWKTGRVLMANYQTVGGKGLELFIFVEDALYFKPIRPYTQYESKYFSGWKVTHAAKINFPVEKTLEEKFKDFCTDIDERVDWATLYQLSAIAKEHYEGEK